MIVTKFWTQLVMYPFVFVLDLIGRHSNNNTNYVVNRSADSDSDGEDGRVSPHSPPFAQRKSAQEKK